MKKIGLICAALLVCGSLAGCGNKAWWQLVITQGNKENMLFLFINSN